MNFARHPIVRLVVFLLTALGLLSFIFLLAAQTGCTPATPPLYLKATHP